MVSNIEVARRIKIRSEVLGFSVASLLRRQDIRATLIYDLERRDKTPSSTIICKLADGLKCSTDYLLGRTDDPTPPHSSEHNESNIIE